MINFPSLDKNISHFHYERKRDSFTGNGVNGLAIIHTGSDAKA
jgi:hypothetical protein